MGWACISVISAPHYKLCRFSHVSKITNCFYFYYVYLHSICIVFLWYCYRVLYLYYRYDVYSAHLPPLITPYCPLIELFSQHGPHIKSSKHNTRIKLRFCLPVLPTSSSNLFSIRWNSMEPQMCHKCLICDGKQDKL